MAITFEKANKAETQLQRSFGSSKQPTEFGQQSKPQSSGRGRRFEYKKREEAYKQHDDDRRLGNCFQCHKPGHGKRECPNNSGVNSGGKATGMFTAGPETAELIRSKSKRAQEPKIDGEASKKKLASSRETPKAKYSPELWVFDCIANRHLVGDNKYFVKYRNLSESEMKRETVHGYKESVLLIYE